MILKALCEYYDKRKDVLPPFNREFKEIGFIINLNKSGDFLYLEDMRSEDRKRASQFTVMRSVERTSGVCSNFLYDNPGYVLGLELGKDSDKIEKCRQSFISQIQEVIRCFPDNNKLAPLEAFYGSKWNKNISRMKMDPLWESIAESATKKYGLLSFRIEGELFILAEDEDLLSLQDEIQKRKGDNRIGLCLVTGEKDYIKRITAATMIPGSQATARLVAFQEKSGYDSYGKEKGENAPIGSRAEFAYTTALKSLLPKDSRHSFILGNKTYLFWASRADEAGKDIESAFDFLVNPFGDDNDSDEVKISKVRSVFNSIFDGKTPVSDSDRFYILGLSPNSARIAVSYWAEISLKEFSENILSHFSDFDIVDNRKIKTPYLGLKSILSAVTLNGKVSDALPNLSDSLVKSIFENRPYPLTLLGADVRRIRAEKSIGTTRAAIIKGTLNRLNNKNKKITKMLDKEQDNIAYLCGRLFAVVEKLQQDANGIATVRDRYMNSASSTPAMVFPTLLRLSNHHAEKLSGEKEKGKRIFFDRLKQEIIGKIGEEQGFPRNLQLIEQGYFFVGYYHQMADFYTPKPEEKKGII